MLTGNGWELIIEAGACGLLYWRYHCWRWPKIGCPKCEGKGHFSSESLVLGHPVRRVCPKCEGKPWRRRAWAAGDEG